MVIWLMGISGSGKSTLGKFLKERLARTGTPCQLIDGDGVRGFFENDLGYTKEDRIANIKRIIFGAHLLDAAGLTVIVCNIAPFDSLRKFARKKIKGYVQIYLKKDLQQSMLRDVKNIYRNSRGKSELVGVDIAFEEPDDSDLVIDTDHHTAAVSLEIIVDFLNKKQRGTGT
jgi:adenylylsulfate kinase-like enzyme